ncbi:peptidoglycan D,D-transpeptidase FtsI family protein [Candidatus Entotheonella palauensis]|uniref:peptidoglycan D,D-transpeptidase FtsI family protein n=1 Tax=Candidatus Entotheonella palauensis TaxID=93172 RepID=UPI000B7CC8C2|nr:penicillin-binding protein 2 [Candidatus Entotheonella palauensis]
MTRGRRRRPFQRDRLLVVMGLFAAGFLVIVGRLYGLQVGGHAKWYERGMRQYNQHATLQPERGEILDRHGRVLATSVAVPSVYAVPHEIEQPEQMASALTMLLKTSDTTLKRRLTSDASFVWLARQVSPSTATQLRERRLPGVDFVTEMRRYYPKHHLAGQLLGFVGLDGQGLGGVEYVYDQILGAAPRRVRLQRDAMGRRVRLSLNALPEQPRGTDVHLTLDERLQHVAEKAISAQVEALEAKSGLVMMMNPHSGEMLAMASYPFFNPNAFRDAAQQSWQRNRCITDPVEPGSTFKVVLAAAVLEERMIEPGETFFCEEGEARRGRRRLRDHHPYGDLSFEDVFAYSSNIGAVKIADRLTADVFYGYMKRFGFGQRTRIDLPGEHVGQLRPPRQWSKYSHDSLALGQEIAVTPIQLLRAFAAIANGGWLVQPRVMAYVKKDGERQASVPVPRQRILSQRTTNRLTSILSSVVSYGTGQAAALEGYTAAGKTGTAQKIDPVRGGYSRDRVLVSFAGYAPAEAPQIVVLVMLDEPQRMRWGGTAAAPVFRQVVQQAMHYLQVPPSQMHDLPLPATKAPDVILRQAEQSQGEAVRHASRVVRLLGTN